MGVQRDTQDFRGSVLRSHCVTDSHLRAESGLVGIGSEHGHAGFLGSNGQLLAICPPHQCTAELVSPRLGLYDAESRGQQREVVGIGRNVYVRDRVIRHEMVGEGWGDDGPLWDPHQHLAGRRVVLLVEARRLPAAEVRHEPSNQVVAESGAVDHLDEEGVRDCVECFRDVHHYGYGSARGLTFVKAWDHPSRDRELGRGGGMPRFEAVLWGASAQRLPDGREDEPL